VQRPARVSGPISSGRSSHSVVTDQIVELAMILGFTPLGTRTRTCDSH
jgi:hypothetical protein